MIEGLAQLHYSCLYEQDIVETVCFKPLRVWAGLSLVCCTYAAGSLQVEATRLLHPGESGSDISALQDQLKAGDCLPNDVNNTSNYDDITVAGVKNLQRQHGLVVDGIVGEQTRAVLASGCDASLDPGALKLGSQGEEVRMLQVQLDNWGFPLELGQRLQPTGVFDEATRNALEQFEEFFGLKTDGVFDVLDSQIRWTPRVNALVNRVKINRSRDIYSTDIDKHEMALIAVGADAVPYLMPLVGRVSDREAIQVARRDSILILGKIGPEARQSIPSLVEVMNEYEPSTTTLDITDFRIDAAFALAAISPSSTPELLQALSAPDSRVRLAIVFALGFMEPASIDLSIINKLAEIVEDQNEHILLRAKSADSLDQLGQNIASFYEENDIPTLEEIRSQCPDLQFSREFETGELYFNPVARKCLTADGTGGDWASWLDWLKGG